MIWIIVGIVVYVLGFIVTAAIDERYCDYEGHRRPDPGSWGRSKVDCNHPWDEPIALLWPVIAAFCLMYMPFYIVFGGSTKIAHKLATIPTRKERAAVKAEAKAKHALERNEQYQKMKARILELESELGMPHGQ